MSDKNAKTWTAPAATRAWVVETAKTLRLPGRGGDSVIITAGVEMLRAATPEERRLWITRVLVPESAEAADRVEQAAGESRKHRRPGKASAGRR